MPNRGDRNNLPVDWEAVFKEENEDLNRAYQEEVLACLTSSILCWHGEKREHLVAKEEDTKLYALGNHPGYLQHHLLDWAYSARTMLQTRRMWVQ